MKLTLEKINHAITLEQAWSEYLENIKTPEERELGSQLDGAKLDQLQEIEESQQCMSFKEFLRQLSDKEFRELQGIMYVGRGDYKATEFKKACEEPGLNPNRECDVSYIMEKLYASNYFADGFEKLNIAGMI